MGEERDSKQGQSEVSGDETFLVAVPHVGTIRVALAEKLLEFDKRDDVELYFSSHRPVDVNRCEISKYFLEETDHDWLVMIDSDIIPPSDVLELSSYDKDIISPMIFSMRDGIPYPIAAVKNPDQLQMTVADADDEVIDVDATGTGCILIRREVFDGVEQPYFEFVKNDDGTMNTGEDIDFTLRAKEAGYSVGIVVDCNADHVSSVSLLRLAEVMHMAFVNSPEQMYADAGRRRSQ